MNTDTPKTNAQIIELKWTQRGYTVSRPNIEEASLVSADFAREIERENTRLRETLSAMLDSSPAADKGWPEEYRKAWLDACKEAESALANGAGQTPRAKPEGCL